MMREEDRKFNEYMDKCERILNVLNTKKVWWFDDHASMYISGEIDMCTLIDEIIDGDYEEYGKFVLEEDEYPAISLRDMLNDPELDWENSDEAFEKLIAEIEYYDGIEKVA